jgi:hypothetical protein
MFALYAAFFAVTDAAGVPLLFQPLQASVIVVELLIEMVDRIP